MIFYLPLPQGDLSSMWQGSWVRLLTVTTLFCNISRVAGWCLLKKITKHAACSTYAYFKKKKKKEETSETGSILGKLTDHSLLKVKFNTDAFLEI